MAHTHCMGPGQGRGRAQWCTMVPCPCVLYSTQHNIETHRFPVPVPVSVPCSVNEPLGLKSLGDSFGKMITNSLVILPFNKMYNSIFVHMYRWLISVYIRKKQTYLFI